MSITRVNFNPLSGGGDNPTGALVKLDANDADLDTRVAAAATAAAAAQSTAFAAQNTASNAATAAAAALPKSGGNITGNLSVVGSLSAGATGVTSPQFHATGSATTLGNQGLVLGWNAAIVGSGDANFFNNIGLGGGGWSFRTVNQGNTQIIGDFGFDTSGRWIAGIGGFTLHTDNAGNLGSGSLRWSALFATNGTIQTSDANAKANISDTTLGLNFINSLRAVRYQMKCRLNEVVNGEVTSLAGQRYHEGLLAQDVNSALKAAGVDPSTCGIWTIDDPADPRSQQGLRYEELIGPLVKAVQELTARVTTLEASADTAKGG